MKNTMIVLLGPTGVGKTIVSIELAHKSDCEIISADSRQFYRQMKIGTAVPDIDQLTRVKHHFIQFLDPNDYYSSSLYERDVLKLLPEIFARRNVVIMTGGSGMYIDAVCNGIDDIPDVDPAIREKYIKMYEQYGIGSLRIALKLLDPEHYSRIDLKNHKRILRALEICESTGQPYSSFLKKEKRVRDFNIIKIGLNREREQLYQRIDTRVDEMVNAGLENEAASLINLRNLNSLNTVGYREFFDYFDKKITHEKAIELIKRNSRRYAKRQLTWWSKDKEITWFNADETGKIYDFINSRLENI